jgi:thiol-disulfide isomerase/thioredoxin
MANLIQYIYGKTKIYIKYAVIVLIVAIFIYVGVFMYNKYYMPMNKNADFADVANANDRGNIADIYFFYADWCPHCKKAKPEWINFKAHNDNKVINGYTVNCIEIDCTTDNGDVVIKEYKGNDGLHYNTGKQSTPIPIADIIRNFGVESYPTIKMSKDTYTVDFDAKVTERNLETFINTVLNN